MKTRTISAIAILFVTVLAIVSAIPTIAAEASATRTFLTSDDCSCSVDLCVDPSTVFTVQIEASGYGSFGEVAETLCSGWTYTGTSLSESQVNTDTAGVVKFYPWDDQTFTYTVRAPSTEGACCTISGILKNATMHTSTVGGEDEVCVCEEDGGDGASATRTFLTDDDCSCSADLCVDPSTVFTVQIEASGYGSFGEVAETLCSGWTYTGTSLSESQVNTDTAGVVKFYPWDDQTFTYTVQAPSTEAECCTITGILKNATMHTSTVGGEDEVCVCEEDGGDGASATRTFLTSDDCSCSADLCVDPSTVFTVQIEASGYGSFGEVAETLCSGWTYTGTSLSESQVNTDTAGVVKFYPWSDETFTYTVQAPSTEGACCTISGILTNATMHTSTVGGEDEVCVCEEIDGPPEPSIISPADGSTVSGTAVPVTAVDDSGEGDIAYALFEYYNDTDCNCAADDGNNWVEIYNDTSSAGGWNATWNTTLIPDCCHLIRVTMVDGTDQNGSAQINVVVSNHAPVPNITAPGNGDVLNRSVVINVTDESSEFGADIAYTRFEYYNDSNCNCEADDGNAWVEIGNDTDSSDGWSAEWDTFIGGAAAVPNGCYMIRATMGDMHGRTGSDEINVELSNPDFCLDLKAGWNLVSIPKRINGSNAAASVFSLTAGESCMHYDGCADGWLSNGDVHVVPCQGYWVYKIADETVCVYFNPGTGSVSPPTENLCTGWNMIGHIDTSLMPVDDGSITDFGSITTIEGKFAQIWQWTPDHGWECYPLGGFAFMTPGQGYWILMTDNATMSGTL